jgi:tRNA U34 2-thiouridine synthase MnmA/TrmU
VRADAERREIDDPGRRADVVVATGDAVLVAMSGGVDSSVAAALLADRGYRVVGATMKTFCYSETTGPSRTCCGLEGIADARSVAARLGAPHRVFDLEREFTEAGLSLHRDGSLRSPDARGRGRSAAPGGGRP